MQAISVARIAANLSNTTARIAVGLSNTIGLTVLIVTKIRHLVRLMKNNPKSREEKGDTS
jgi:cytochrome b561